MSDAQTTRTKERLKRCEIWGEALVGYVYITFGWIQNHAWHMAN